VSKELNHLASNLHVYAGVWILWSKKYFVIIFQKENRNTFTLLVILIVKSLQKEQNSTNLLLWPPICRNKPAITPKWFNSLDTNSKINLQNSIYFQDNWQKWRQGSSNLPSVHQHDFSYETSPNSCTSRQCKGT
jgi:hypothetical protein